MPTGGSQLNSVTQSRKNVRKWFKVLAAVTACLALVYPFIEAMDSTAITDSDTEFEVLTFLLVLGILVALIRLVLLAVQMLIWGSIQGASQPASITRCPRLFLMVRPPGLDPVPSLRI
jgi:hypothetical protein